MKADATLLLSLVLSSAHALPTGWGPSSYSPDVWRTEWDVIIVGAGPAGIIVAERMSATGRRTLLLEQGGPSYYSTGGRERPDWLNGTDLSRVDVPGLYKSIYSDPGNTLLCNSSQINAYSGCTIGGCTAINAGLFFQPPASDFDTYFPDQWKSSDVAGAIGRLRAMQPSTNRPSTDGKYYLQSGYEAAKEWLVDGAGYKELAFNEHPNKKTKTFGHPEYYYVNGQRSGPVKTYLQSALSRPTFHLQHGVQVKRVERSGALATGVVVSINGTEKVIKVVRDEGLVVLSGGALFSPQLLMLSGIGDPVALQNLSSNGLLELPASSWINNTAIGDGLFDNPNTFIELSSPSVSSYAYSYSDANTSDIELYLSHRSGPYTFASQTSAFWDTVEYPNGDVVGVQGTIDSAGFQDYMSNQTITLNVYGTSGMKSTGRVTLDNNGVPGPEKAFFYTDPQDADAIATFVRRLFDALPKSSLTPLNIPQNATKEEIKTYITTPSDYATGYVNHWSSSCRLGSCVDTNTKVKDMRNLYVVDASILPPLTVNPSFGVMVAAEWGSELILSSQGL